MCLRDATLARQCVLCRTPAIAVEYSESACSLCTGQGMCSLVLALNSELELEFQKQMSACECVCNTVAGILHLLIHITADYSLFS